MNENLDELRQLLMQVPAATGFQDSVRLLEESFAPSYKDALSSFAEYDGVDFHGRTLLEQLYPQDLSYEPWDRYGLRRIDWIPEGSRRRVQKWAVVGYAMESFDARGNPIPGIAQTVLLNGARSDLLRASCEITADRRHLAERILIREGLMNRRQAILLASHLNRFRRNGKHLQPLNWRIVAGPGRGASAREWLNGLSTDGALLRRWLGELELAGLGENACGSIEVFRLSKGVKAHEEQVFAIEGAQTRLPPRFHVRASVPRGSSVLPEDLVLSYERKSACKSAASIALNLERVGGLRLHRDEVLKPGLGYTTDVGKRSRRALDLLADELWGELGGGDGSPIYEVSPEPPSGPYALALSKQEAVDALKHFRSNGFRGATALQHGIDGIYGALQYEGSIDSRGWWQTTVSSSQTVPAEIPFVVTAAAHLELDTRRMDEWSSWERNFYEEAWKNGVVSEEPPWIEKR
jgi:hypothetical protein